MERLIQKQAKQSIFSDSIVACDIKVDLFCKVNELL